MRLGLPPETVWNSPIYFLEMLANVNVKDEARSSGKGYSAPLTERQRAQKEQHAQFARRLAAGA